MSQSVIQTAQNSGTGATVTATLGSPTTAGSTVVVAMTQVGSTADSVNPATPTGPAGMTNLVPADTGGGWGTISVWFSYNDSGGNSSYSVTAPTEPGHTTDVTRTVYVFELGGMTTVLPSFDQDQTGAYSNGFGTNWFPTAFAHTPAQPHEINISFYASASLQSTDGYTNTHATGAVGTGYIEHHDANGASAAGWNIVTAYPASTAPGTSVTTALSGGQTNLLTTHTVSFKEAPQAVKTIPVSGTGSVFLATLLIITKFLKAVSGGLVRMVSGHVLHIVQIVTSNSSGSTNIQFVTSPTGAGHTLAVFIDVTVGLGPLTSITPPAGWHDSGAGLININSQSDQYFQAFYFTPTTAGATSFTFNFAPIQTSVAYSATLVEISGVDPSFPAPDVLQSNNHAASSSPTTGTSSATSFYNEMVVQAIGTVGGQFGNVMTGDGSYTNTQVGNNSYNQMVFGYKVTTGNGTQSATDTLPSSALPYAAVLMTFRGLGLPVSIFRTLLVAGTKNVILLANLPAALTFLIAGTGVASLATVAISIFKAITVVGTHAVAPITRFFHKHIYISSSQQLVFRRILSRIMLVARGGTTHVLRQLGLAIVVSSSQVISVGRALLITIAVTGTHVAKVLITRVRLLFVAGTGLVRLPWTLHLAALLVAGTGTVVVIPAFVLTMLVVGTHVVAAIIFTRLKKIAVTGTHAVSFTATRAILIILAGTGVATVTVRRIYIMTIKALNTGSRVAIQKLVKLGWTIYGGGRV